MSGKPDWMLRAILALILLVLAARLGVDVFRPVGRYVQFRSADAVVGVLDSRTGRVYMAGGVRGVVDVVAQAEGRSK